MSIKINYIMPVRHESNIKLLDLILIYVNVKIFVHVMLMSLLIDFKESPLIVFHMLFSSECCNKYLRRIVTLMRNLST